MATFTKRGDTWRVQVSNHGRRESKTFPTKREAAAWATAREAEIATMSSGGVLRRTLRQALERYRDEISPQKRGERWEVVRINHILGETRPKGKERPEAWEAVDRPMQDITTTDLAEWRDRRLKEVKGSSVLRDIALLRSVWAIARKEWKYTQGDPWADLSLPRDSRARERLWLDPEIVAVLDALGWEEGTQPTDKRQETAVTLLLALETAMRSGELLSLSWSDVDLERRVASLDMTKNGDSRRVPLSKRAVELFGFMRGIDPDRVFTVNDGLRDSYFRQARDLAGIVGVTFHDARATALTRLSKKLSVLELARMVGHRDPRSLMVYYRESAEDLAARLD